MMSRVADCPSASFFFSGDQAFAGDKFGPAWKWVTPRTLRRPPNPWPGEKGAARDWSRVWMHNLFHRSLDAEFFQHFRGRAVEAHEWNIADIAKRFPAGFR